MSERPGRYQRSFGGLVGAMVLTLVAILAFVAFRAVNRDSAETKPEPVDWESAVSSAQGAGIDVVHPAALPQDWVVTSVNLVPAQERPTWGMGMLTDTGAFVGLRQEEEALSDLLEVYVDEDTDEDGPVEVGGDLGGEWTAYSDAGGDVGLALVRDGDTLLVYGSAPQDVLVEFAGSLTEAPLAE